MADDFSSLATTLPANPNAARFEEFNSLPSAPPVDYSSTESWPERYAGNVAGEASKGWDAIKSLAEPSAGLDRLIPLGPARAISGAWGIAASPVNALFKTIDQSFPALKQARENQQKLGLPSAFNLPDLSDTIGTAATLIGGSLHDWPLAMDEQGQLTRIVPGEDGRPTPKVIGPPPKAQDFEIAASAIKSKAPMETIVAAAIRGDDGKIFSGPNHASIFNDPSFRYEGTQKDGFLTSTGRFVDRVEADKIANNIGTGKNRLGQQTLTMEDYNNAISQKLVDGWQTYGIHPYEYADAAARSPVMARDLSSATTPPLPLPPRPSRNYLGEVDDDFHRLRTNYTADQAEMLNFLDTLPDNLKDGAMQEKWYRYGEGDPNVKLTPLEADAYNKFMVPLKKEELQLWETAKKTELDVDEYDPGYMHRMVIGKNPTIDKLAGQQTEANPIYNGPGLLSRSTSSMHERRFFALEGMDGSRRIVTMHKDEPGGFSFLHEPGAKEPLVKSETELHVGDEVELNGQKYRLRNALTSEIEANTKVRYYKNALVNTLDNVLHLRAVNRAIYAVQKMRDTPEWAQYTRSAFAKNAPDGWIAPQMPLFRNDLMDSKLANVIDDFYGRAPVDGLAASLEKINHYAVGSMFWTPVPHALNAAHWWATERGWDWVTPSGMKSLVVDGAKAVRQVVTQGPEYQRLLREGASLIYGGVANRDFYKAMLERAGMELPKDPEWEQIAKVVGMAPVELVKGIYNAASDSLWAFSDAVMLQRVFELERKGMNTRAAIAEAEKLMPNYRVPSEILSSRAIQQIYTSPQLFQFSRYHYGILKGYANMAKDLAVGNMQQRWKAIGSIMALGVLQLLVAPGISAGIQKLTGDDDLKYPSAGPGRLAAPVIGSYVNRHPSQFPKFIRDYYKNDGDLMQAISNMAPLSPVVKWGTETAITNRYSFSGRPIAEPADVRDWRWKRVLAQEAEHTAQTLVEPYNTFNEAWKTGEPIPQILLENAFGLSGQTEEQQEARERAFHYQERESVGRQRKPAGAIESITK